MTKPTNFKKVRVYRDGVRMNDQYLYASKWQVFKQKVRNATLWTLRTTFRLAMLAGLVYGAFSFGKGATEVQVVQAEDRSQQIVDSKIDGMKASVIDAIQACESKGHDEDDGIIIFDSNNKASIGTLQFQKSTVIHYYKVLYGKEITAKEAVLIALDDGKAEALAKDIVFKAGKRNADDWFNCSQKNKLDARIDAIKALEK